MHQLFPNVLRSMSHVALTFRFHSALRTWSDAEYFSDVPGPATAIRIRHLKNINVIGTFTEALTKAYPKIVRRRSRLAWGQSLRES
jgi:hypothetical protein